MLICLYMNILKSLKLMIIINYKSDVLKSLGSISIDSFAENQSIFVSDCNNNFTKPHNVNYILNDEL